MKCKFCGKKGVRLSHFMREHKALMARKSAEGRRKNRTVKTGERLPRKGKVHRGRKREVHVTEQALESGDVTIIIRRS